LVAEVGTSYLLSARNCSQRYVASERNSKGKKGISMEYRHLTGKGFNSFLIEKHSL
jgi:hypothetical protein